MVSEDRNGRGSDSGHLILRHPNRFFAFTFGWVVAFRWNKKKDIHGNIPKTSQKMNPESSIEMAVLGSKILFMPVLVPKT